MSKKLTKQIKKQIDKPSTFSFQKHYPATTRWLQSYGWIEMGDDGESGYFIKVLDEGGLLWSSSKNYHNIDAAFQALEKALAKILKDLGD